MAKSDRVIQSILDAHSELTVQQVLELYQTVRNQVLAAAYEEHGTVEIEIRQRRHRVTDPDKFLRFLEDQIRYYEKKVISQRGPARTYARINFDA